MDGLRNWTFRTPEPCTLAEPSSLAQETAALLEYFFQRAYLIRNKAIELSNLDQNYHNQVILQLNRVN